MSHSCIRSSLSFPCSCFPSSFSFVPFYLHLLALCYFHRRMIMISNTFVHSSLSISCFCYLSSFCFIVFVCIYSLSNFPFFSSSFNIILFFINPFIVCFCFHCITRYCLFVFGLTFTIYLTY